MFPLPGCILQQPLCWCREPGSNDVLGVGLPSGSVIAVKDVSEAVRAFRRSGAEALITDRPDREWEPLWEAACDFVAALLLGIHAHLPALCPRIDLREGRGLSEKDDLVSLSVRFHDSEPIVGEVATLSRCCFELRIDNPVTFSLRRPAGPIGDKCPVDLHVSGFELPALADLIFLRSRLTEELGAEFDKQAAHQWFLAHKDEEFPLQESKFHRMFESLFGQPSAKLLPRFVHEDALWGYLHNPGCPLQSFSFHSGSRGGVAVTAERRPPRTSKEASLVEACQGVSKRFLTEQRSTCEKFSASATAFCAMLYGPAVGQEGADARVITKLFSAAKWWGCGSSGWQQWDVTYLVKDKRNALGLVTETQGRILWRIGGSSAKTARSDAVGGGGGGSPRSVRWCCRRRKRT